MLKFKSNFVMVNGNNGYKHRKIQDWAEGKIKPQNNHSPFNKGFLFFSKPFSSLLRKFKFRFTQVFL